MNLIDIINENFDRVLKESQSDKKKKSLKESLVEDNISNIKPNIYRYITFNHYSPEYLNFVKSDVKLDPDKDFGEGIIVADITNEHGSKMIAHDDESIYIDPSKPPKVLDNIWREAIAKYLKDLDDKGQLDDFEDDYMERDSLIDVGLVSDEDNIFGMQDPGYYDKIIKAYRKDPTLKKSYLSKLVSNSIKNSHVDGDSGFALDYVDLDDMDIYVDYDELYDDGYEDDDEQIKFDDEKIAEIARYIWGAAGDLGLSSFDVNFRVSSRGVSAAFCYRDSDNKEYCAYNMDITGIKNKEDAIDFLKNAFNKK